jgi:hypothetical protein
MTIGEIAKTVEISTQGPQTQEAALCGAAFG